MNPRKKTEPMGDKRRVTIQMTLDQARELLNESEERKNWLMTYVRRGVDANSQRCPDCLSPPGARHHCLRDGIVRNGDFS